MQKTKQKILDVKYIFFLLLFLGVKYDLGNMRFTNKDLLFNNNHVNGEQQHQS